jgi:hypothetical protein
MEPLYRIDEESAESQHPPIHRATPHRCHQSHPSTNILTSRGLSRAPTSLITAFVRRDLSRPRTSREDVWTTSLADVVEVARQARASIRVFAFTVDVAGGDVSVYMTTYKDITWSCVRMTYFQKTHWLLSSRRSEATWSLNPEGMLSGVLLSAVCK